MSESGDTLASLESISHLSDQVTLEGSNLHRAQSGFACCIPASVLAYRSRVQFISLSLTALMFLGDMHVAFVMIC